jgi:hypothetical protein
MVSGSIARICGAEMRPCTSASTGPMTNGVQPATRSVPVECLHPQGRVVVKDSVIPDGQVGVEAENFLMELHLEPAHDGKNNDQRHHPQTDAEKRQKGNGRKVAAAGLEKLRRKYEFQTHVHHQKLPVFAIRSNVFSPIEPSPRPRKTILILDL